MAGQILLGLATDLIGGGIGSLINAGANAINQKVEYDFNKKLQSFSFAHDKEMLQAQVDATRQLQQDLIQLKQDTLLSAGYLPADAARGSLGVPMTKALDWNGTRYWAPNSMSTSSYSGRFSRPTSNLTFQNPQPPRQPPKAPTSTSGSTSASSVSSAPTVSTGLSSSSTTPSRSSRSSTTTDRTREWVDSQNLGPYMDGALQTAFVTPPSSRSSSVGTVSTVPDFVLDSWTPSFNTRRQPLFAHLRRRGESQA
ncbi:minor structural protein [Norovirus pig/GII/Ch6/China/2009]|uniref:Minor structural protein n=1 Tax=Norovirus pig/GII/Ch6/China/2009 TaxID=1088689 RepID=G8CV38_NORV|nr:minor structural protein [Norovirus pig/GII/Ch6/China/2009]